MSTCAVCGRVEGWDKGTQIDHGWACSRCSGWAVGGAVGTVATLTYQGAELAGYLGHIAFSTEEDAAIRAVVSLGNNSGSAETMWGVGMAAYHRTTPSANVVVVYRFVANVVTIYGIGRHKGATNDEYFVLRWNGSSGRVRR